MSNEKKKILKMIEDGIITAEEGFKLLEAISEEDVQKSQPKGGPKWVRIQVVDERTEKNVNIKLPISVLKVAIKFGAKFSMNIDGVKAEDYYDELIQAIDEGVIGEVVNVETDDGNHVCISLE